MKQYPIRIQTLEIPNRLASCDIIEVRVSLTPLRWGEKTQQYESGGDSCYSVYQIVRLEMADSHALFYVARQLLQNLFFEYFGMKL